MLSDYFGDPPPSCNDLCDVCRDPQGTSEAINLFHQLSWKSSFNFEEDNQDLDEGII